MAKKLSFDKLPAAVEKILEILTAEGSEHTAIPELVQRMTLLEKKFDNIERILSPDRPTMDKQTVLRILKLRPRMLCELENTGVLLSHSEGRRTVYYEDDVVRCFMNRAEWKAVKEAFLQPDAVEPEVEKPTPAFIETEGRQRIDVKTACEMLGRSAASVYKCISEKRIPFHKDENKVYFYTDELRRWATTNPARKRRKRSEMGSA